MNRRAISTENELRTPQDASAPTRIARLEWLLVSGIIAAVLLVVGHRITLGELNLNGDEAAHANTALFFARLIRDHPLHPVQYTYQYYAHSPSLGVVHWPPLAYIIIAVPLLLWPSVATAKGAILFFAAIAMFFVYRIGRYFLPMEAALLSIPIFGLMPGLVLYEKAVMLEVPCLAFLAMASYYLVEFLDDPCRRKAVLFSLAASASLLTKQNAVYLPLFCILLMFAWRRSALLRSMNLWIAVIGMAILVGPYYFVMARFNGGTIASDLTEKQSSIAEQFLFYLRAIPHQAGYILLIAAALGALLQISQNRRLIWFAVTWIVSVYVAMLPIGHKEERYVIYWLPAFALSAVSLFQPAAIKSLRWVQAAAAATLLSFMAINAWNYQRPYITGYAELAHDLLARSRSGFVLVDDPHVDDLIFQLNTSDPKQRLFVLRKILYVVNWKPSIAESELIQSPDDIAKILDEYGIRYVVASNQDDFEIAKAQQILRDYLHSGRFRLIKAYTIGGNDLDSGANILLYENLQVHPIQAEFVRVPMLTISHDIVVPVDR